MWKEVLNQSVTIFIAVFFLIALSASTFAEELKSNSKTSLKQDNSTTESDAKNIRENENYKLRVPKYHYDYYNRRHSLKESFGHISAIYGVTWLIYPLTQPDVVKNKGSWKIYKENFGKIVFDQDEPFWNWFVHPLSGSQLYLYYRANGYSRSSSMAMATISSTLFEFTVEIYTEPASIQDLYQTPVLGSVLGFGIENLSMYLLNTGVPMARFFGHLINPATLFWFYEGKVRITPTFNFNGDAGLFFTAEF